MSKKTTWKKDPKRPWLDKINKALANIEITIPDPPKLASEDHPVKIRVKNEKEE